LSNKSPGIEYRRRFPIRDRRGNLPFNHLFRPFDNPAIRRALLGAVDQAEAMTAIAGTDPTDWHDGIGLFGQSKCHIADRLNAATPGA
jgi:hypothetical protein